MYIYTYMYMYMYYTPPTHMYIVHVHVIYTPTHPQSHTHTQYYAYWPSKGESETYGNIRVSVSEESAEHYYTIRVISLSNAKVVVK